MAAPWNSLKVLVSDDEAPFRTTDVSVNPSGGGLVELPHSAAQDASMLLSVEDIGRATPPSWRCGPDSASAQMRRLPSRWMCGKVHP
jgi:hypothetical protein